MNILNLHRVPNIVAVRIPVHSSWRVWLSSSLSSPHNGKPPSLTIVTQLVCALPMHNLHHHYHQQPVSASAISCSSPCCIAQPPPWWTHNNDHCMRSEKPHFALNHCRCHHALHVQLPSLHLCWTQINSTTIRSYNSLQAVVVLLATIACLAMSPHQFCRPTTIN